jgi:hypothetical protein
MRVVFGSIFGLLMASNSVHAALIVFRDQDPNPTRAILSGIPDGVDVGIIPDGENLTLNFSNSLANAATQTVTQSFVLYEPGTTDISDILTLQVIKDSTIFKVKLQSDLNVPLPAPDNIVGSDTEKADGNTIPLDKFTLPLPTYKLTIEVRSDFNTPEPSTLILATSMVPVVMGSWWLIRRGAART